MSVYGHLISPGCTSVTYIQVESVITHHMLYLSPIGLYSWTLSCMGNPFPAHTTCHHSHALCGFVPDPLGHRLLGSNAFVHVAVNIFVGPFCFSRNPCSLFYRVRVPHCAADRVRVPHRAVILSYYIILYVVSRVPVMRKTSLEPEQGQGPGQGQVRIWLILYDMGRSRGHIYRLGCYLSDSKIILASLQHNYIRSKLSQLTVRYPHRALFFYRSALPRLPRECQGESSCSFSTWATYRARDRTPFESTAFFADIPNKSFSHCQRVLQTLSRTWILPHNIDKCLFGGLCVLRRTKRLAPLGYTTSMPLATCTCGHCPVQLHQPKSCEWGGVWGDTCRKNNYFLVSVKFLCPINNILYFLFRSLFNFVRCRPYENLTYEYLTTKFSHVLRIWYGECTK